jgi:hypothetical protein
MSSNLFVFCLFIKGNHDFKENPRETDRLLWVSSTKDNAKKALLECIEENGGSVDDFYITQWRVNESNEPRIGGLL